MEDLYTVILNNIYTTALGLGLFIVCYFSNMSFSIWYNTKIEKQQFDWEKILNSILKILAFGTGTLLLCIGVTTIPVFCTYTGVTLPEEFSSAFEKIAILAVFVYASCKYILEAYTKFKAILKSEKIRDN